MILEFKTKRDVNGNTYYLGINTEARTFTRISPRMNTDGAELKRRDFDALIKQLKESDYKSVD